MFSNIFYKINIKKIIIKINLEKKYNKLISFIIKYIEIHLVT